MLKKSRCGYKCWEEKFKKSCYKLTKPRRLVLEVMNKTAKHLSAEEIYIAVHKGYTKIGLTTIYRTLNLLICMSLISKCDFGDKRARYELTMGDCSARNHHHLVCLKCLKVIDYTDYINEENKLLLKIEKGLAKKYKFKISSYFLQFCGLCQSCKNGVK